MKTLTVMTPKNKKKRPAPAVDYRRLTLRGLNTPEFSHVKLLLYWPVFGLLFLYLERFQPHRTYYPVHCFLDDLIPFCELALIPYLFWFVFLIGGLAYTFFFAPEAFRKMMYFVIFTYTAALIFFAIFPTCQHLRPLAFARDNVLTRISAWFYTFDTNTNVCPSLHVVGSVAAMLGLWDCPRFQTRGWKTAIGVMALCISLSTVFMKQHSVTDILVAVPICLLGWLFSYGKEYRPADLRYSTVKE